MGIALVALLVVGFVVLAGRDEGEQAGPEPSTASDAPPALSIPPELAQRPLPAGDYGPMCQALLAQAGPAPETLTPERFADAYASLDFDRLIEVAPPGIVADLTVLRDRRDEVVGMLDQVDSIMEIGAGDLPAGYLEALVTVGRVVAVECTGSSTAGSSVPGSAVPGSAVPGSTAVPTGTGG